ncbi:prepilin-type N-terminal cleavage/methylation domain-containing protein [Massilia aerilata]|uniref:Prepilin-type N-terminal cleavage/methylation domain-containing protein n=1 Tax=Massilia aerilata TaxID=453817 RepID=A0ABW0RRU0_9BURK
MSNKRSAAWPARRSAGATLVELIIAMVIIGVALAGLVAAFRSSNRGSVDPLILQQKAAIAESLMGEILLKPYDNDANPSTPNVRDTYNDVMDFNNYGNGLSGIRDVNNTPIAGLETYSVAVKVSAATLDGATPALKIAVSVSNSNDAGPQDAFVLTGWRTAPVSPSP